MITHAQRPYVLLNLAMTADGKIATANRAITTFGSEQDSDRFYKLRATTDAIMSGARTVDTLPITMGSGGDKYRRLRLRNGLAENAVRVIVSGRGTIDPSAEIFKHRFAPLVVLTSRRVPASRIKKIAPLVDEIGQFGDRALDIAAALEWLRSRWTVKRLLCEGGGELDDLLFRADMVDEINLTVCPFLFGGRTAPTISEGIGFARLSDAREFRLASMKPVGNELFAVFQRK